MINAFAQQSESGYELYERGEYEKAAAVLRKVADVEENRRSLLYLGMSYLKLNKNEKAVEVFKKADGLSPRELPGNETAARYVFNPTPNYTRDARSRGITGNVKLAVEFGADGEIKQIFPFKELGGGLTDNSITTARRIKFEPATRDGKPVSSMAIIIYGFGIR